MGAVAQMPGRTAGRIGAIGAPRLHRERIPRHHDAVGHPAAALSAPKAQVLQLTIALSASDDGRRSAGAWWWQARHQTNKQSHESWLSMVLAVGGSVILVFDQPLRHANANSAGGG
jgi:hypothetical protein